VLLHTYSWGEGPPLVCVHGVTGHGARFRKLAEERLTGFATTAVDLRGHGHSGYQPPWNLETHVGDLIETADALGIGRAHWLGFSLGGRIVAELAARAPDRVERLLLLDPALQLPPEYGLEASEDELTIETFGSAAEAIDARYADGSLISTPRELLEDEMRDHLTPTLDGRLMQRYFRPAAIAAWGEMTRVPPPPAHVPTLIAVGTESQVPTAEHIERYRAELGDRLRVERIHSGHSLLWDDFAGTATVVADFLA
jgi:lipase